MVACCASLLHSLYVVFMATFLAVMLFFWLELFGDLAAGNMQVRIAVWTTIVRSCSSFCTRATNNLQKHSTYRPVSYTHLTLPTKA